MSVAFNPLFNGATYNSLAMIARDGLMDAIDDLESSSDGASPNPNIKDVPLLPPDVPQVCADCADVVKLARFRSTATLWLVNPEGLAITGVCPMHADRFRASGPAGWTFEPIYHSDAGDRTCHKRPPTLSEMEGQGAQAKRIERSGTFIEKAFSLCIEGDHTADTAAVAFGLGAFVAKQERLMQPEGMNQGALLKVILEAVTTGHKAGLEAVRTKAGLA